MSIDFDRLKHVLVENAYTLIPEWFPNGKRQGREWVVGNIDGDPGSSLSINLDTGVWSDFATGNEVSGGDLIALYAAQHKLGQGEAARILSESYDIPYLSEVSIQQWKKTDSLGPSPYDAPPPSADHMQRWSYKNTEGNILYWIYRRAVQDGKSFSQWSWDMEKGKWIPRSYPSPRPLYNLPLLAASPLKKVLIVEGEKCVDAAETVVDLSKTTVTTWSGGCKAIKKTDWSILSGRTITIWPDADKPGIHAGKDIAERLIDLGCNVRLIDVSNAPNEGWDIADAISQGWDKDQISSWARSNAVPYARPKAPIVPTTSGSVLNVFEKFNGIWNEYGLQCNAFGRPYMNLENTLTCLRYANGYIDHFCFNQFTRNITVKNKDTGIERELRDIDILVVQGYLQRDLGLATVSKNTVHEAICRYAHENSKNPVVEWLDSLCWDNQKRLEEFFVRTCKVQDSSYTRDVTRNLFLSLIARIYQPGAKVDNMVILEGKQGIKKSTLLEVIASPEYYAVINKSDFRNTEYVLAMEGNLIVEISELHVFRTDRIEELKSFLTTRQDTIRRPYGRCTEVIPRGGIFVGTTNHDSYLADTTGARRFWPLKVEAKSIDLDYARKYRDQVFAEAKTLFKSGHPWYLVNEIEAPIEQNKREVEDLWDDHVREYLTTCNGHVRVSDIAEHALFIPRERQTKGNQMRIASILRRLGWNRKTIWESDKPIKIWERLEQPEF